jgi:hypothetical protein
MINPAKMLKMTAPPSIESHPLPRNDKKLPKAEICEDSVKI